MTDERKDEQKKEQPQVDERTKPQATGDLEDEILDQVLEEFTGGKENKEFSGKSDFSRKENEDFASNIIEKLREEMGQLIEEKIKKYLPRSPLGEGVSEEEEAEAYKGRRVLPDEDRLVRKAVSELERRLAPVIRTAEAVRRSAIMTAVDQFCQQYPHLNDAKLKKVVIEKAIQNNWSPEEAVNAIIWLYGRKALEKEKKAVKNPSLPPSTKPSAKTAPSKGEVTPEDIIDETLRQFGG